MDFWSNWSGRHEANPERLRFLRSEADAAALAADAAAKGQNLRCAGSGHSHAPLIPTDGVIADVSGLSGLIDVDPASRRAWVYAGTRIHALGRALNDVGLALANQGDIDRQAIGGAIATGTHGTGAELKNLSAAVTGARIALASGELVECSADQNASLWQAARLNLGALGIITRLHLQLRDTYVLAEHSWRDTLDNVMGELSDHLDAHRHFEFFWYPKRDIAFAKSIDEIDDEPAYPLGAEGERVAYSHEVLPNHRPDPHTEMEYSVPREHGAACMLDLRDLITREFPDMRWPVEYRTLAADDVWLSTARDRDTVTISVHEDVANDEQAYFRACEEVFLQYGGRPHWGKVHYLGRNELSAMHPDWEAWWSARDAVDPNGVFLNATLAAWRPS